MLAAAVVVALVVAITLAWLKPWQPDTEPASVNRMVHALPSEPSIAILPFNNLSGDPEQDFLADGFTEEITTTLSQTPDLFVIARNSTDPYEGKAVSVKQVAEEQGVHFVLVGSIQRTGDRIRVNAQLIDALKGKHLWAERYDRQLKDLFAVQDDISHNIAVAMHVELIGGDWVRRRAEGLDPEAYRLAYKANWHMDKFDKENMAKSRELLSRAQAISPDALFPLVMQGWVDAHQARFGWSPSRAESLQNAEAIARQVLVKDESYPEAIMLMGMVHSVRRELDEAIEYYNRAIRANPNHANAIGILGLDLAYAGRPEEAIAVLKKAMRLSPYHPVWMDAAIGLPYMMTSRYDKAIQAYQTVLASNQLVLFSHERLAAIYALNGNVDMARVHAAKVLEIKPDFSVDAWSRVFKYKNQKDLDRELDAMRKAGLPENPVRPPQDKPAIAVLPFDNLSGDIEQQYFSDGMTDDLITDLSKVPGLTVIARTSSFSYRSKSEDIRAIAQALDARYVVEGSVRRANDTVRINAQLIDAQTGLHVWAERYDAAVDDIFSLQDRITRQIVEALAIQVSSADLETLTKRDTGNLKAYDLFLQGSETFQRFSKDDTFLARGYFEQALELDPAFARAYAMLAWTYVFEYTNGWSDSPTETLQRGLDLANESISLNDQLPVAYFVRGLVHRERREYVEALAEAQRAIEIDPNYANGHVLLSTILYYAGRAEEGLRLLDKASRLNPHPPSNYPFHRGQALFILERYEEAIEAFQKGLAQNPASQRMRVWLAASYVQVDRLADAEWEASEILTADPEFSPSHLVAIFPFQNPADLERFNTALRKAGFEKVVEREHG
jgi:TolB-like protein/Flp pilus assembly protein TadD